MSVNTPRKQKLRKTIRAKAKTVSLLKSKLKAMKTRFPTSPKKLSKFQKTKKALALLEGVVPSELLDFIKKQVHFSKFKSKGRRYDIAFKAWALTLYHISGKAYRFLAKLFNLPSKRTLTGIVSKFASDVGFSEKSLYVIKKRVDSLPPTGKVCTLLMDEVSLKSHLFYDASKDSLVGLQDCGNGETSGLVANSALVLMARGIIDNWKQPIAYYLVNESCDSIVLKDIISEAILHLESMGLMVVGIVSDQGSNFIKFNHEMGVTVDKPYFEMRGKIYFTIFDPPHLLKSVRNNLMRNNFECDNKVASWEDIKTFFNKEQKLPIRTAPKLTEKHLNPNGFSKMKVKLASQVLSHSVAAGINTYVSLQGLPGQAIGTAILISKIDKIFDCCNSSSFKNSKFCRRPFSPQSPHLEVMEEGINFFKSIKVVNPATGVDKTNALKCLKGWCHTLRAITCLWRKMYNEGIVSFLVTRQLNQDPLENFFGSIRQQGGNSDNPTPIQFKRAYRKLFHTNLLSVVTGNCESDDNELLMTLGNLEDSPVTFVNPQHPTGPLKIISTDYATEDMQRRIVKDNAIAYVAGYLLRKSFCKHKCSACSMLVNDNIDTDRSTFLFFKAYDTDSSMFGGLVAPSEEMIEFTTAIENKFIDFFRKLNKTHGIGKDLLQILEKVNLTVGCQDFAKDYLLKLFIRMRIYYCLKFANRNLEASKRKNRKYLKIVHL